MNGFNEKFKKFSPKNLRAKMSEVLSRLKKLTIKDNNQKSMNILFDKALKTLFKIIYLVSKVS